MDGTVLFGCWYLTYSAGSCVWGWGGFRGNLEETAMKSDVAQETLVKKLADLVFYTRCKMNEATICSISGSYHSISTLSKYR